MIARKGDPPPKEIQHPMIMIATSTADECKKSIESMLSWYTGTKDMSAEQQSEQAEKFCEDVDSFKSKYSEIGDGLRDLGSKMTDEQKDLLTDGEQVAFA